MEVTMNRTEISALVQRQRYYFSTGATLPVEKRIRVLKNLRATLKAHEADIAAAVEADLGKCATETFMCETGLVISELSYMLAHIRRFAREQNVLSPLPQFPSRSYRKPCPYGGGCVNDCVIHLATSRMGFGGVGESGMGEYHGKTGFDTFTHYNSIVDKKTWLDLPMRYQPYTKVYDWLIHLFLR